MIIASDLSGQTRPLDTDDDGVTEEDAVARDIADDDVVDDSEVGEAVSVAELLLLEADGTRVKLKRRYFMCDGHC